MSNVDTIIGMFGGIRPMAKKLNIAVTTVQGWKKRSTIPESRFAEIQNAAKLHNINIGTLLSPQNVFTSDGAANNNTENKIGQNANPEQEASLDSIQNGQLGRLDAAIRNFSTQGIDNRAGDVSHDSADFGRLSQASALAAAQRQAERQALWRGAAFAFLLFLVAGAGFVLLAAPSLNVGGSAAGDAAQIAVLQAQIKALEQRLDQAGGPQQGSSGALASLPKDVAAQISALRAQAEQAQAGANEALAQASAVAAQVGKGLGGTDAEDLTHRLAQLERNVKALTGSAALQTWAGRLHDLAGSQAGQQNLRDMAGALFTFVARQKGEVSGLSDADFSQRMQKDGFKNDTLRNSFESIPAEDLKAAALLLGMAQLRTTLARDNASFEQDLALLTALAGKDDAALQESLARLAPYSAQGVLTPEGLTAEFQALAAETAAGAVAGDNVSLQERAQARLNALFQVKKDGTLVTGTPTQTTLDKSEALLAQGDLAGAIAEMQNLSGTAASAAAPWISRAKGTLAAQQAQAAIATAMRTLAHGPVPYTTGAGRTSLKTQGFQGLNVHSP